MLLPVDGEKAWEFDITPVPDELAIAKGEMQEDMKADILTEMGGDFNKAQTEVDRITAETVDKLDNLRAAATKASKRIEDWQVESQHNAQLRRVIDKAGQVGSGVLKGPFNKRVKKSKYIAGQVQTVDEIIPVSKWISHWNFYPDPSCGNSIHDGSFTWEKDDITEKVLRSLKGTGAYIDSQIDRVLSEDPCEVNNKVPATLDDTDNLTRRKTKGLYQIWYYYGRLKVEDMQTAGLKGADKLQPNDSIDVEVVMVNNHVIRAIRAISDQGEFPYDIYVWQEREGMPWGSGLGRQLRPAQRIINGATRNMMDNAGRSAGPQVIVMSELIEPDNDIWEIRPWKIWHAKGEDAQYIDKAFRFVNVDMMQDALQAIIYFGLKIAEDITGLPMILQGQMGQKAPKTLGGMEMLQNNASSTLRRLARLYDDYITTPNIRRTYRWLLKFGKHDDEKGDFEIAARGSSALVEREIKNQTVAQLVPASKDPVYGLDPKKVMKEFLKTQRLNPKNFEFDDDKWQKVVEQMAQGPNDPRLAAAQLRVDMDEKLKAMELGYSTQKDELDRQLEIFKQMAEAEIAKMEVEGVDKNTLDRIRGMLASDTLKLTTQERLSTKRIMSQGATKEVINPPSEPAGKAPTGQSWQK